MMPGTDFAFFGFEKSHKFGGGGWNNETDDETDVFLGHEPGKASARS